MPCTDALGSKKMQFFCTVPGQTSKRNMKSVSSAIFSQQISGKNSGSRNKIAMKSFSKNQSFGVDFKLQVPLLMYKINTHIISGVRNQVNNPDLRYLTKISAYLLQVCLFHMISGQLVKTFRNTILLLLTVFLFFFFLLVFPST